MCDSRIAIYSQDSLGLGHLRRTTVIGRHILEQAPGANILLFTDSPAGPFFQLPEGMDHLKLPSLCKVAAGCWRATRLQMDTEALLRFRAELLRTACLHFRPDVLLIDHMPAGARGELLPALKALKQAHPDCSVVLGLRDILDARDVVQRVWENEAAYSTIHQYYDRVLVYGNRDVFDTARTYELPAPRQGIHYCGYVVNPDQVKLKNGAHGAGRRFVYVSAGGGGDSALLMRTYVSAIRLLGRRAGFTSLMAVGVNSPPELVAELQEGAAKLPVRVVSHVSDGAGAIAAADLVVCMAGYNTLAEVLKLGTKALVVPRSGPSAEQRMRTRLFAQRGLIDALYPEELSAENLAQRLLTDLERDDFPARDRTLDLCGGIRAAQRILELTGEEVVYANAV